MQRYDKNSLIVFKNSSAFSMIVACIVRYYYEDKASYWHLWVQSVFCSDNGSFGNRLELRM
jgi:hypothetical protein